MKTLFIISLSIFSFIQGLNGQSGTLNDTCKASVFKEVDLFIPGSIDTIQNDFKVKAIYAADLINGFELRSTDSSIRIVGFTVVFINKIDGALYRKAVKGFKVQDDEKQLFSISKIADADIITIEEVFVQYRNDCYRAKSQIYLCR